MPPKKTTKISLGQLTLFGEGAEDSASMHSEQPSAVSKKRGDVISWRKFATQAYRSKHPWLDVHSDDIYCKFCVRHTAQGTSRSGSGVFISEPFTGTWPDALAQHAASDRHGANALSFRQSAERLVACKQLEDLVAEAQVVSVDGEALLDAMRCLYFLLKPAHYKLCLPSRVSDTAWQ